MPVPVPHPETKDVHCRTPGFLFGYQVLRLVCVCRVQAVPRPSRRRPGRSGAAALPQRVAGTVGDSLAGGPRVSCDSAAGRLPPAAAGPFPERPGGGGRRGATIGARTRGCGRQRAGTDSRAGGGGARGSSRAGREELCRRLAGSGSSAHSPAGSAMGAGPELPPPPRAVRWTWPGGGRRAPSSAAPGALRTRRSRARWQHVCGVRSPEAAGQGGDHARRHPEDAG
ncbi:E3 ubiquitin-protein ligase RING1-like [Phodopus roborovskii]|uniref:E3 ubiquitin-protein ligase RING1-like n=1 Tax=Phodopus roborovskii TaxID=109678 RepID=UPI0021E3FEE5|nr:E3 ubiquitin-protein ligase RING1-like [Phodopus roborovskii]